MSQASAGLEAMFKTFGLEPVDFKTYNRLIDEAQNKDAQGLVGGQIYDANFTSELMTQITVEANKYQDITTKLQDSTIATNALISKFEQEGGQMKRVADALEAGEVVEIRLSIDGKTVTESVQAHLRKNGKVMVQTVKG